MSKPIEVIRVTVERNRDGWYMATSPDMPGLLVANPDESATIEDISTTISALYKAQHGLDVVVREAAWPQANTPNEPSPWVAMRPEIAAA